MNIPGCYGSYVSKKSSILGPEEVISFDQDIDYTGNSQNLIGARLVISSSDFNVPLPLEPSNCESKTGDGTERVRFECPLSPIEKHKRNTRTVSLRVENLLKNPGSVTVLAKVLLTRRKHMGMLFLQI